MRVITEIAQKKPPLLTTPKLKACAYVRVSTDHEGQLNSLQNQTEYYEQKLRSNKEYEYCGIFSDSGISGAKENRPGFLAMMEKARNGELDLIITKSISRFARSTIILLQYVRELKKLGVGVLFEQQKINTLHSEGELLLTVLAAIAEEERKSVCGNVRWAMQSKSRRGEVMVDTNRLLGFDKDENGELIINKTQAKIVRRIYSLYLAGVSAHIIAKDFTNKNIPTYTRYPWSAQRILRILSNEKYKGDCLLQKSFVSDSGKQKPNRGEKEQYYIKANHPAIISPKDWEAVQSIRKVREKRTYPYTSLLCCPYCGASLIRVVHQHRWVSWICATYMQQGRAVCAGMRIAENILEKISKTTPIIEMMVIEEVLHDKSRKKRTEEDFRFVPAAEYLAKGSGNKP